MLRLSLPSACAACLLAVACVFWNCAGRAIPGGRINSPTYAVEPALKNERPAYRFAVHPLHNPQRLFANFQPVIDVINERAKDFSVRLIAARDYRSFEKRLTTREFDFALANPLQTLYSLEHGYQVVAKMGDDNRFYGIIIARRDSGLDNPADMRGCSMVFPSPTALAATMMPRLFLHERGADLGSAQTSYSGSQESAIMNVYLGKADIAGTWPMPWELFLKERPELAARLHVLWKTAPLVNNAVVARRDLPERHVRRVVETLLGLSSSEEGRTVLKRLSLSAFEAADTSSYVPPVRSFLDAYRKAFPSEGDMQP